jgi:predicted RNA-binding Zn-ribbon protein involved in translation (DUF1610 family)
MAIVNKKDPHNVPARFFCEECGNEIDSMADHCEVCGKHFAGVRCPKCGNIGASKQFTKGCPFCGYGVLIDATPRPKRVSQGPKKRSPLSGLIFYGTIVLCIALFGVLLMLI